MDLCVEEFTTPSPVTISPETKIHEAQEIMFSRGIRHLLVLEKDKVAGVISERDVLANYEKTWASEITAGDIMSTSLLRAYVNDNLGEVAFRLSKEKKGSAIIYDLDENLYGVFTTTDALNALVEILMLDEKFSN